MKAQTKRALGVAVTAGVLSSVLVGAALSARPHPIRVRLQPRVIDYRPAHVSVAGIAAASVSVRLEGANDPSGLAYERAPYRWLRLRLAQGRWHGALPAPPLRGVYQLQLRVQRRRRVSQSPHWLLQVMPPGTLRRRPFPTPRAVIRNYVGDLPGNQVLVVARRWPPAAFDRRDPRLNRLFVVAYAPRGNDKASARRGLFITTVRDGYGGRWRLLEATTAPYD
jgi:hypothetical protein